MATRRSIVLGLTGSAIASALPAGALAGAQESDEETAEIILDTLGTDVESVVGSGATAGAARQQLVARIATWAGEPAPTAPVWPSYEKSLDFIPDVGDSPADASVTVNGEVLNRLLARFGFLAGRNQRLLVSIRGATPIDPQQAGAFSSAAVLRRVTPDHLNLRCSVGVWDRSANQVCFFPGSTIPEFTHMRVNLGHIGGCNISPLGLYDFAVGLHTPRKKYKQPGAFLQAREVFVLRTTHNAAYDVSDPDCFWDRGWLGNDIHSAIFTHDHPKYSSAGCIVIRGFYDKAGWVPQGSYAAFRLAAGLSPRATPSADLTSPEDGHRFQNLLLSFTDLYNEANGVYGARRFLRYGASGPDVARLQARIGVAPNGAFDANTMEKWIAAQQAAGRQEYPVAPVA